MDEGFDPGSMNRKFQWRALPAKELLARIEPLLHCIGAAPPLDISFADDLGIPVYLTVRTADLRGCALSSMKEWGQLDLCCVHSGKGLGHEDARVSCIMEAIERYSAGPGCLGERVREDTFHDLGDIALDPRDFYLPPGVHFSPDKKLQWYHGTDVISGRSVAAPVDCVLMDMPDSAYHFEGFETKRLGFFFSNGLSAGPSLDEALISGICEVVERDAQYRLLSGDGPMPTELLLAGDPDLDAWVRLFAAHDLTLRGFYLNHVDCVYTAIAVSWDRYCRIHVTGMAADPDLRTALTGAILELIQQRSFTFFSEWKTRRRYFPIIRYIRERIHPERYADEPPASLWTGRCGEPLPVEQAGEPFPRDLQGLVSSLSRSHRVVGFDLTHPELAIPVARVLISGMKNGYLDFSPVLSFIKD